MLKRRIFVVSVFGIFLLKVDYIFGVSNHCFPFLIVIQFSQSSKSIFWIKVKQRKHSLFSKKTV